MAALTSERASPRTSLPRLWRWAAPIAGFVFPSTCPVCGTTTESDTDIWCAGCLPRVRRWGRCVCPQCRRFRPSDFSDCPDGHAPVQPTFVAVLGPYDAAFRAVVGAVKYRGRRSLARLLAREMAERLDVFEAIDTIVAVPTSTRKVRERGFGHAEEIARHLAADVGLPFRPAALYATRRLADQTRLSATQREANLSGAFAVRPDERIKDRGVLVVDDVTTTGATLADAARALTEAGARRVGAVVVALNLGGPAADLRF
ncbi:MAG TPA: ComF family protein [Acidobacteriota bacterium]|nr:ComF family protein [Acidobacteriota bacterium]